MLFQTIYSIDKLNSIGILHLDLHSDNILLSYNERNLAKKIPVKYYKYELENKQYYIPNYGIVCKISDFGLSENLEFFRKRSKRLKKEIGDQITDKLINFMFTPREERDVENARDNIVNNFANGNPVVLFKYMKVYDMILFLTSLIAELSSMSRDKYMELIDNLTDRPLTQENKKKLRAYFEPPYMLDLRFALSKLFTYFLETVGAKKLPKNNPPNNLLTNKFFSEIFSTFEKNGFIKNTKQIVINKKIYK